METKLLYDNAFDLLLRHISDNKLLRGNGIGSFINIFDLFYILDFLYYKKLF